MHTTNDHHGTANLFCPAGKLQDCVGLAGHGCKPHHIRCEIQQGFVKGAGVGLQIQDGYVVISQVSGQNFETKRFSPENLFNGLDPEAFLRDGSGRN